MAYHHRMTPEHQNLRACLNRRLVAGLQPDGHWASTLSSSALSTAVAAFALHRHDRDRNQTAVDAGLDWLRQPRNDDGGWGDTVHSPSNPSTTLLAWSALAAAPADDAVGHAAGLWIEDRLGTRQPDGLAQAVLAFYGRDRTFSVPILTMTALAGRLGQGRAAWEQVPQLPFELAVLPRACFRLLRLQVVSYALPALIAVGLVRFVKGPPRPLAGWRYLVVPRLLRLLQRLQPDNGGFLEAPPLTGFVLMCLAAAGHGDHPVAQRAADFLQHAQRPDGSWPIDTNLDTWVTSLAVAALGHDPGEYLAPAQQKRVRDYLLQNQQQTTHPFTRSPPGGWGWTHADGAVPDADDTAGALGALHRLDTQTPAAKAAAQNGVRWLLGRQNADGGMPTFCRGWGRLPFDQSCPDLAAHALDAVDRWLPHLPDALRQRSERAAARLLDYLARAQTTDGTWLPLWFGNQQTPTRENPVYGTARVLSVLLRLQHVQADVDGICRNAVRWLVRAQNADGGWGGAEQTPASVEETGLALHALAAADDCHDAIDRGLDYLQRAFDEPTSPPAQPIGLYFSALWYSEERYPLLFAAAALNACR